MSDTLIKVEGVSKKFCRSLKRSLWYGMQDLGRELLGKRHGGDGELRKDEFWAIKDVSFEVKRGECLGLIGHNGAGKTTLLRMINGLIKPDSGRMELRGRVGGLIALGAGFNPVLTGRENISVNASILGLSKDEIAESIDSIIEFSGLSEFIDMPVQSYSSGMSVRLGFAIAIHTRPEILLLDEVLAVGDMDFQTRCFNALSALRENGTAFIIVSHNMHQIERHSSQTLVLNRGRQAHLGETADGIASYLNLRKPNDASDLTVPNWGRVYGSGCLVLSASRFINQNGIEISNINAGEGATLELSISPKNDFDGYAIFDVSIQDETGTLFRATNIRDGSEPFIGKNISILRIHFHTLPSTSSYLHFGIAALSPYTNEIYDWKKNIRLNVANSKAQHGKLELPVSWETQ